MQPSCQQYRNILYSRDRGGMTKIELDFAPASTGRFATMRVNACIFLFIAVLIGIWIKRVLALIALFAAAHQRLAR